jgi:hypothetical protein
MKKLLLASALMAAATTSSFAMTMDGELPLAIKIEAQQLVPTANLDNLTKAQALAIADAVHGDETDAATQIRSILING